MIIDEANEKIDLSDHKMIEANFLVDIKKKDRMSELVQREYYKFEEGDRMSIWFMLKGRY